MGAADSRPVDGARVCGAAGRKRPGPTSVLKLRASLKVLAFATFRVASARNTASFSSTQVADSSLNFSTSFARRSKPSDCRTCATGAPRTCAFLRSRDRAHLVARGAADLNKRTATRPEPQTIRRSFECLWLKLATNWQMEQSVVTIHFCAWRLRCCGLAAAGARMSALPIALLRADSASPGTSSPKPQATDNRRTDNCEKSSGVLCYFGADRTTAPLPVGSTVPSHRL